MLKCDKEVSLGVETGIESPCIRHCCLDTVDICMGCFRSLEEIKQWHEADEGGRLAIIKRADERHAAHLIKYPRFCP